VFSYIITISRIKALLSYIFFLTIQHVVAESGYAQWTQIPSPIIGKATSYSIHYKDGILWVGTNELYSSTDLGVSWTKVSIGPFLVSENILSISFYDRYTGLVSVLGKGLYLTSDGGVSWKLINNNNYIVQADFNKFPNVIHAFQSTNGKFLRSLNGGTTWSESTIGTIGLCFAISRDRVVYAFSYDYNSTNDIGFVYVSTDLGSTWVKRNQVFDPDCWSIVIDSCDPGKLYLLNEENLIIQDSQSEIFISNDYGNSWQRTFTRPSKYLTGALINTGSALYASTQSGESLRSSDNGMSWTSYPAYSGLPDSRDITFVDDNTLFAIDSNGVIWKTQNGGGDSITSQISDGNVSFSLDTLFQRDTVFVCSSPLEYSLILQKSGCRDINVLFERITGNGKDNYQLKSSLPNTISKNVSVTITFSGVDANNSQATYEVGLSNGVILRILLLGVVRKSTILALSENAIKQDTIGGGVYIPISVSGLPDIRDIEIVLHYDPSLEYVGSVSTVGQSLDIINEPLNRRSRLRISNAVNSDTLGYSIFKTFTDSSDVSIVMYDSLLVLGAISPCEFIFPSPAISAVTPPSGCGIQILSDFVRYGHITNIDVFPNPASQQISISSDTDINGLLEIIDMHGEKHHQDHCDLKAKSPQNIDVSHLPSGTYILHIKTGAGIQKTSFIISR
jgi:photosystem II stability/assembly factor-like uncharacterized protein